MLLAADSSQNSRQWTLDSRQKINFFLASTPSAQDYYNGLVTGSTSTTPVVSSIAKVDTDPTNASKPSLTSSG